VGRGNELRCEEGKKGREGRKEATTLNAPSVPGVVEPAPSHHPCFGGEALWEQPKNLTMYHCIFLSWHGGSKHDK